MMKADSRTIIAVCEDGSAWSLNQAMSRWTRLPRIPTRDCEGSQ
jgi:hypothetical protein